MTPTEQACWLLFALTVVTGLFVAAALIRWNEATTHLDYLEQALADEKARRLVAEAELANLKAKYSARSPYLTPLPAFNKEQS